MALAFRAPTYAEYTKLREAVGWRRTDESASRTAFRNSLFSVIALEDGEVVGLGRVIGDGGLYFYIQDLIVHPGFQQKGLGKELMGALLAYIEANARPGAFVGLMAAKGLQGYYASFGFKARPEDAPGMYRIVEANP